MSRAEHPFLNEAWPWKGELPSPGHRYWFTDGYMTLTRPMEISPKFLLELLGWGLLELLLPPLGEGLSEDEANMEEIRAE